MPRASGAVEISVSSLRDKHAKKRGKEAKRANNKRKDGASPTASRPIRGGQSGKQHKAEQFRCDHRNRERASAIDLDQVTNERRQTIRPGCIGCTFILRSLNRALQNPGRSVGSDGKHARTDLTDKGHEPRAKWKSGGEPYDVDQIAIGAVDVPMHASTNRP